MPKQSAYCPIKLTNLGQFVVVENIDLRSGFHNAVSLSPNPTAEGDKQVRPLHRTLIREFTQAAAAADKRQLLVPGRREQSDWRGAW